MNLSCLPRSVRRPSWGSRLVLAALALLVAASLLAVLAPASGALASSRSRAADALAGSSGTGVPVTQGDRSAGSFNDIIPSQQEWSVLPANVDNGTSYITNLKTGGCLDVAPGDNGIASVVAGAQVIVAPCTGASDQQWYLQKINTNSSYNYTPTYGDVYVIFNWNSGLFLDVKGASVVAGAQVIQYSFQHNSANQEWSFQFDANGYYNIINSNSGKYLEVTLSR